MSPRKKEVKLKTTVKPLPTLVRRDRRGVSSAGGPRSAGNLDSQAPGDGDRREKQQQPAPVLAGIVTNEKDIQERSWKGDACQSRHEATTRKLPEPRPGKVLLPKDLPAGDGSPVGAEESGKLADSPRRRPLPHGRNQDHHGTEVNLPAEKPNRWRCHPLATTVPIATEAEPQAVWLGEIIATARLAGILGRVQPAAARARLLAGIVGEVLVDRKKKRPEAGVARQIMIQSRVLRYAGNIQEYTPREPRSSDQALRGDFQ